MATWYIADGSLTPSWNTTSNWWSYGVIYRQLTEPADPSALWLNTSDSGNPYYWNGSSWSMVVEPALSALHPTTIPWDALNGPSGDDVVAADYTDGISYPPASIVAEVAGMALDGGTQACSVALSVASDGTLQAGNYDVAIALEGEISGGTYGGSSSVTLSAATAEISGGEFYGEVNNAVGTISGGTLQVANMYNSGTITGGSFTGTILTNSGVIDGGSLDYGSIVNTGFVNNVTSVTASGWSIYTNALADDNLSTNGNWSSGNTGVNAIIAGNVSQGTFTGTIEGTATGFTFTGFSFTGNYGYFGKGAVTSGDFSMGTWVFSANMVVSGGTWGSSSVTNNGSVAGGTFACAFHNSATGTVSDGTFTGASSTNAGTVSGGTWSAANFTNSGGGTVSGGTISGAGFLNNGTLDGGTVSGDAFISLFKNGFGTISGASAGLVLTNPNPDALDVLGCGLL